MHVADFDYLLPEHLIAQFPPAERGASRLMHVAGMQLAHHRFGELPALLRAGDLLVFNDTKVIKARLFGRKESGGAIEALVERVLDTHQALAQVRASKAPRPGAWLLFDGGFSAQMIERQGDLFLLRFSGEPGVLDILEQAGRLPLPPYITHDPDDDDARRYQTVYARDPGAVAAPTAGLHFTDALLDRLRGQGVNTAFLTLHVGAGTFQPVRVDDISRHTMHHERYRIPAPTIEAIRATRAAGDRVIAVGTTSLRALEAASQQALLAAPEGDTGIFITPGYRFRVVDRLITNFHLPRSTLLMLVSAFAGMAAIRQAYAEAVAQEYRFFSYGDAMLLERAPEAGA
ncbi:tRNA preQ1(34) S-adenosylmethionine ribosyltransferase-isomerase QueA [Chitiniphilus purpureus]|uniref:S-adenosylmethionine:tRNA ribosyltransferase-isomerase n=1 Tax=Chitiniphilus purpureus TaxID=2981137 RepID=A0ABY6DR23_9NEIS|nr:tRNA preQ1(34) S-adenosylmethionine ribosyltransferase-isomerase QueA [Chitiniphilus sp. CD1]UXY16777.1 tRNA preQ1(34) S-adenosylmethionine ribosyltransferase-isomerase QueA [Chitiniphilus sp. CD1]